MCFNRPFRQFWCSLKYETHGRSYEHKVWSNWGTSVTVPMRAGLSTVRTSGGGRGGWAIDSSSGRAKVSSRESTCDNWLTAGEKSEYLVRAWTRSLSIKSWRKAKHSWLQDKDPGQITGVAVCGKLESPTTCVTFRPTFLFLTMVRGTKTSQ